MIKKGSDKASHDLSEKILLAPNVFYAAHIMNNNMVYFGNGGIKQILDILKTKKWDAFKDIGRKLAMLRDGYLYQ